MLTVKTLANKLKLSHVVKYRFPSLFAVDTFFKYWTANYETANKKTNLRLKLKDWFFKKRAGFGLRISETADKKTANIEGRLYSQ